MKFHGPSVAQVCLKNEDSPGFFVLQVRLKQIKMLSVSIHLYEPQQICRELNKSTNIFVNFFKQITSLFMK